MTLLIGANLGDYSLLAADTRVSYMDEAWSAVKYKDGDHKIVTCSLGLISGSGYVPALEAVKDTLLETEVTHTNQVVDIIKAQAVPHIEFLGERVQSYGDRTCFLASYRTLLDEKETLRLGSFHQNEGFKFRVYEDVAVVMPGDSNIEEAQKYRDLLKESLVPFQDNSTSDEEFISNFSKSFLYNMYILSKSFKEISDNSSEVSSDFDVAALCRYSAVVAYVHCKPESLESGEIQIRFIPEFDVSQVLTP